MKKFNYKTGFLILPVAINTTVFLILSILHFYWAFGGKLWLEDVLPTNSKGLNKLSPGTIGTLVIAFGLLAFALITAGSQGLGDAYINRKYLQYGVLIIAILFLLRAVGDFKFIGFFKTIKGTRFAVNDTQTLSPLCLIIALLSLSIYIAGRNSG